MKFTICVLCRDSVISSNCKGRLCRVCWSKIKNGDDLAFNAYMEHNILLEAFPKQRGRFVR